MTPKRTLEVTIFSLLMIGVIIWIVEMMDRIFR